MHWTIEGWRSHTADGEAQLVLLDWERTGRLAGYEDAALGTDSWTRPVPRCRGDKHKGVTPNATATIRVTVDVPRGFDMQDDWAWLEVSRGGTEVAHAALYTRTK